MADDVEIIKPPNTLKSKVSIGGPNAVDESVIARAEKVISDMKGSYIEWVAEDFKKVEAAYKDLVAGSGDRQQNLDKIFAVAHDIKGQGGSFGYDLVTQIGNHLCRLIERFGDNNPDEVENEAIKIHVDAMKLVIAQDLSGDGGDAGKAIISGIQKMDERLSD
ncbi:MAG: Hpt domain-containing protein [Rhodospirillales bacterium]